MRGISVAMKFIRTLAAGVAAAAIATPVLAQSCLQPAERTAMEVRALQSQLMVAAIACGQTDQYNAFVSRNQRDLAQAFRTVEAHFKRVHGNSQGQRQLDNYITQLANAQSQDGIDQGTFFCSNVTPLFKQAMAETGPARLASVSYQSNLVVPYALDTCDAAATPARQTTPARRANRTRTASR
ncbi:signal peptide protein, YSIRK family [Acetobacteraceae bacterium AT-5844]|nr:signal peptide protein, YSIRK family [Acetobacteraceae bacterium AT-5844]